VKSGFSLVTCRLEVFQVQDFRSEAKEHALQQAPREACGVVVDGQYWRCRNIADNPEQDFVLNPCDYAVAALFGAVEAVVHSHPMGGRASKADIKACCGTKVPWHIYSMPEDKWSTINPC
jgi:uncharacterized repeat protein (TIGR04076 family)